MSFSLISTLDNSEILKHIGCLRHTQIQNFFPNESECVFPLFANGNTLSLTSFQSVEIMFMFQSCI